MANIRVESYERMKQTADKLRELSNSYKKLYEQLLQEAKTISGWEGADNAAFVQKINGLTTELQKMSLKIATDADLLDTQRKNIEDYQGGNIDEAQKLPG